MTQASPTILLYEQAAVLIDDLLKKFRDGTLQTTDELSTELRDILTRFELTAGKPLMQFEMLAKGEPPLSSKMNRFWNAAKHDVDILQNQVDLLRASAVFVHNSVAMEINRAKEENARLRNKISTLQLYSSSADTSVVVFQENFGSDQFIDYAKIPDGQKPSILENTYLALGKESSLVNLTEDAQIAVLESSNGFQGNNQEIAPPETAPVNPVTNQPIYRFIGETARNGDPDQVLDGEPNTWFEYEHCYVSPADRLLAGNQNFEYQKVDEDGLTEVDWAKGPPSGVLKLDLEIDLLSDETVNYLSYTPYGLQNNNNYPVYVRLVQTSVDGTAWQPVAPQKLWIGSASDIQAARTAENITVGTAVWSFEERQVRYIRLFIEQPNPVNRPIGHAYYINRDTNQREEGPLPPIEEPTREYGPGRTTVGKLVQYREFFNGKRWAIGIRDLLAQQVSYVETSAMISKPIKAGGLVDRVTLDADTYIPPSFASETSWIRYYISPDDGDTWVPISRVADDYLGLPEILAFNDPTPEAFQETGVQYVTTQDPVESIRVKIEMERDATTSSTPLVRSYTVRIKRR